VQTSAGGDHFKALPPVKFVKGPASNGIVVTVTPPPHTSDPGGHRRRPDRIVGLRAGERLQGKAQPDPGLFLQSQQANFTLSRTVIGASDFCVKGKYFL